MRYSTVELNYVSWENVDAAPASLYLICTIDSEGRHLPVRLGRGRFATVAAASANPDPTKPVDLFALKFLSRDADSASFSRNARARFFMELAQSIDVRGRGHVVKIRGSSRIKNDVAEYAYDNIAEKKKIFEEKAFEDQHPRATRRIEETAEDNWKRCEHQKLHPDFLEQVQGEFFVMQAEEGSLEDFLLDWRPWKERKIFQIQPELGRQLDEKIQKHSAGIAHFFKAIQDPDLGEIVQPGRRGRSWLKRRRDATESGAILWPEDCSGLTILNFIGTYLPALKTRIVLQLVAELVDGVSTLHRNLPSTTSPSVRSGMEALAHRDIKLGNFLFSFITNRILLGDLGFVAPSATAGTIANSPRESGMQALGSRLFRAPEQRDALPAPDVRLRVLDENRIEFFGASHVKIEPGDQLEVPDLLFGKFGDHRVTIERTEEPDGHRTIGVLSDKVDGFCADITSEDYLAFLMKPSGQFTDVFAIGCTLYFLASGGKNPEDFFDSCLKTSIVDEVSETCLSLALAICVDDPAAIRADAIGCAPTHPPDRKRWTEFFGETAKRVRPDVLSGALGRAISLRGDNDVERLVASWRRSPQIGDSRTGLLRDRSGHAIPFPIVYEVIRCMQRDKSDSYVTRGAESQTKPLWAIDCSEVTSGISAQIQQILMQSESAKPDIRALWPGEELDLFFTARVCLQGNESRVTGSAVNSVTSSSSATVDEPPSHLDASAHRDEASPATRVLPDAPASSAASTASPAARD